MSIDRKLRKSNTAFAAGVVVLLGVLVSACQNTGGYGSPASSPPPSNPGNGGGGGSSY